MSDDAKAAQARRAAITSQIQTETGIDEAVSFTKGCYIGQEIIARIHFRGHVAKKLTGLILNTPPFEAGVSAPSTEGADGVVTSETPLLTKEGWRAKRDGVVLSESEAELTSTEGKPAGRITSAVYSPKLDKMIALGYVRYEFLAGGTQLKIGDRIAKVANFPVL